MTKKMIDKMINFFFKSHLKMVLYDLRDLPQQIHYKGFFVIENELWNEFLKVVKSTDFSKPILFNKGERILFPPHITSYKDFLYCFTCKDISRLEFRFIKKHFPYMTIKKSPFKFYNYSLESTRIWSWPLFQIL